MTGNVNPDVNSNVVPRIRHWTMLLGWLSINTTHTKYSISALSCAVLIYQHV